MAFEKQQTDSSGGQAKPAVVKICSQAYASCSRNQCPQNWHPPLSQYDTGASGSSPILTKAARMQCTVHGELGQPSHACLDQPLSKISTTNINTGLPCLQEAVTTLYISSADAHQLVSSYSRRPSALVYDHCVHVMLHSKTLACLLVCSFSVSFKQDLIALFIGSQGVVHNLLPL